jgi:hypothetical protein
MEFYPVKENWELEAVKLTDLLDLTPSAKNPTISVADRVRQLLMNSMTTPKPAKPATNSAPPAHSK